MPSICAGVSSFSLMKTPVLWAGTSAAEADTGFSDKTASLRSAGTDEVFAAAGAGWFGTGPLLLPRVIHSVTEEATAATATIPRTITAMTRDLLLDMRTPAAN